MGIGGWLSLTFLLAPMGVVIALGLLAMVDGTEA